MKLSEIFKDFKFQISNLNNDSNYSNESIVNLWDFKNGSNVVWDANTFIEFEKKKFYCGLTESQLILLKNNNFQNVGYFGKGLYFYNSIFTALKYGNIILVGIFNKKVTVKHVYSYEVNNLQEFQAIYTTVNNLGVFFSKELDLLEFQYIIQISSPNKKFDFIYYSNEIYDIEKKQILGEPQVSTNLTDDQKTKYHFALSQSVLKTSFSFYINLSLECLFKILKNGTNVLKLNTLECSLSYEKLTSSFVLLAHIYSEENKLIKPDELQSVPYKDGWWFFSKNVAQFKKGINIKPLCIIPRSIHLSSTTLEKMPFSKILY